MIKNYILNLYLLYIDSILLSRDTEKKKYIWNKIRNNKTILDFATNIENDSFKSNIIVSKILQEKNLFNTDIYNKVIKAIYSNINIANKKIKDNSINTFLLLTLTNENLILTKEQKVLLILQAENSPFTEKYYKNNNTTTESIHGLGIMDIRYKILCNISFNEQEKRNLINMFYPDDEIKILILKELEYSIMNDLNLNFEKENNDEIYELNITNLKENTKSKLKLCKYIKEILPEKIIKSYLNNE